MIATPSKATANKICGYRLPPLVTPPTSAASAITATPTATAARVRRLRRLKESRIVSVMRTCRCRRSPLLIGGNRTRVTDSHSVGCNLTAQRSRYCDPGACDWLYKTRAAGNCANDRDVRQIPKGARPAPRGGILLFTDPRLPYSRREPQGQILGIHVQRVVTAGAMDPVRWSCRVRDQVYVGGISVRLGESPVATGIDRAPASSAHHQAVEVRFLGQGPSPCRSAFVRRTVYAVSGRDSVS
jgi:hypothetical protein